MTATRALPATQTTKLAERLEVIWIHGRTGQQIEETSLPAGTLVSAWAEETDFDGGKVHLFLASEDGGETWNRYQSFDSPVVAPINPGYQHTEDERGSAVTAQVSRGPKPPAAARKAIR